MTLDYSEVAIDKMITHIVGNSDRSEALIFSEGYTEYSDVAEEYLIKYLLQKFNAEDLYSFDPEKEFSVNKVFYIAKSIFEDPSQLIKYSKELANLLYANSNHPKIKESKLIKYETETNNDEDIEDLKLSNFENKNQFVEVFVRVRPFMKFEFRDKHKSNIFNSFINLKKLFIILFLIN